eukprot:SAG31_NODE_30141_length_385_cov_0.531469_2_plen_51_part_01
MLLFFHIRSVFPGTYFEVLGIGTLAIIFICYLLIWGSTEQYRAPYLTLLYI